MSAYFYLDLLEGNGLEYCFRKKIFELANIITKVSKWLMENLLKIQLNSGSIYIF